MTVRTRALTDCDGVAQPMLKIRPHHDAIDLGQRHLSDRDQKPLLSGRRQLVRVPYEMFLFGHYVLRVVNVIEFRPHLVDLPPTLTGTSYVVGNISVLDKDESDVEPDLEPIFDGIDVSILVSCTHPRR